MKTQVNTASDRVLDYMVAVAEGATNFRYDTVTTYWITLDGKDRALSKGWSKSQNYCPSTDWGQCGAILEREGIDVYCGVPTTPQHEDPAWRGSWRAKYHRCGTGTDMVYGVTAISAVMRAYVIFRLGTEVDVPEELL